jgi:Flp pilus assembly protein TadB
MPAPVFIILFLGIGAVGVAAAFGYVGRPMADAPERQPGLIGRVLANTALDLAEAGISMSATRFWAYSLLAGGVVAAAGSLLLGATVVACSIGAFISFYAMRSLYVGRMASRRRSAQLVYLVEAARTIAQSCAENNPPLAALRSYGESASSPSLRVPGAVPNQIGSSIFEAVNSERVQGIALARGLPDAAERLGNRYFRQFVSVYLANVNNNPQVELPKALRQFATDLAFIIDLRDKRRSALSMSLMSYQMVAAVVVCVAAFVALITAAGLHFYGTWYGQAFAVFMAGYLFLGYRLQRKNLNERF